MRPRSIVFDLFGDYLRYRGGEARLLSLVSLLDAFGVGESTARVALARLRRDGWFDTRSVGRETIYTLTPQSWQMLDEGRSRIFERASDDWDGQWRMVIYEVPETGRSVRDAVRKELVWLGFGPLATSTWVTPRDQLAAVEERFGGRDDLRMELLTCRTASRARDVEMAARSWDLAGLDRDYAAFVKAYRPRLSRRPEAMTPQRALVLRTELTRDYRRFPFRDPDLPAVLLPPRWHGNEAYELFMAGHDALGPAAEAFVDEVLGETPVPAAG